ncbi:hypothetical protein NA56DRAFT_753909 [Hyaloscypha hepaticicola]|uniref:BTB domain-containing protein n=1 Tax=Hyaloscypha hepaticicola TaxID=2082293 RepID=A0A2J6PMW9_9HELO|nr:hypothetical protein NA56DRAFT_753909 [Hyaloscypha hepaticicola]
MPEAQSVIDFVARCFDTDDYSDLTVKCRERSWKVHRLIVCSQSRFLHAACTAGFKEAHTGIIDLDDDDPVPVEVMLKYFYTGKYNEPINESKDLRLQLQVQVLTYNLADKYDLPTLMELAAEKFRNTLNEGSTAEEYLSVVRNAYIIPKPSNALRTIVIDYARREFQNIMQSPDLDILRATLQEEPEFAFDVLQSFVKAPLRGYCSRCGPNQEAKALQACCKKCGKGGISVRN